MKITRVSTRPNFILEIEAEGGVSGEFDVRPYLDLEAFEALKDPLEFKKIRCAGYYIEWECGADLSADTIEARLRK